MKLQNSNGSFQAVFLGYIIASVALFFYSYTQVDLSLTLSSAGVLQTVQREFQRVGYFERPGSTLLYVGIVSLWFALYGYSIWLARHNALTRRDAWKIIGIVVALLVFSYPAFSYDLFNYVFTAKTVLVYHKNPYEIIPLQFAGIDPLVSIMRWTHLPSAYTPVWILLTLPAYLLGFGKFLLIMWNLKILVAFFYVLAARGVHQVLTIVEPKLAVVGTVIFALNPLVIIESIVSAHNDIAMMAIAVWALVLFLKKRESAAWIVLALSVAVKLMSIMLIPVLVVLRQKAVDWRKLSLASMMVGFFFVLTKREPLPWYGVWFMPFVAFLPAKRWLTVIAGSYCFALLLRYAPYLYFGNWNAPVPVLKWWVTVVPVVMALLWLAARQHLRASPRV